MLPKEMTTRIKYDLSIYSEEEGLPKEVCIHMLRNTELYKAETSGIPAQPLPRKVYTPANKRRDSLMLVGDFATLLRVNYGKDVSRHTLFQWLRQKDFLDVNNMPTSKAMKYTMFRLVEGKRYNSYSGEVKGTLTAYLTSHGRSLLVDMLT